MDYSYGTDEYIQHVLNRHSTMLIKLAFTYVKNIADAEDITLDVFVSLMKKKDGFERNLASKRKKFTKNEINRRA